MLNFISMFYTARYFTKNTLAGIIGGIIYAFNPLIYSHFTEGHYQLISPYFLPPLFLFCYTFIRKPTYTRSFLFSIFFTLNGLTSIYFLILSTTTLLFFIPACLLFTFVESAKRKKYLLKLAKNSIVGLPFLFLLLYFLFPYLQFSLHENAVRTINENLKYSGYSIDWLMSTPNNWLYGKLVHFIDPRRIINPPFTGFYHWEHTLFLNIAPTILCFLGIKFLFTKIKKTSQTKNMVFLLSFMVIMIASYIFTTSSGAYLGYHFIPILKGIRAPSRFEFIFYVPFSLFAAYGILQLKRNKRFFMIFCFIFIAIFIENIQIDNFKQTSYVLNISKTHKETYAKLLKEKKTIHIPAYSADLGTGSTYLNWSTITGEIAFNGYSGHIPLDHVLLAWQVDNNLNEDAFKKILALKINYIIIHKKLLDNHSINSYKKRYPLYSVGKIHEDSDVLIIDMKKYKYPIYLCDINKNLNIIPDKNNTENSLTHKIILENKSNCYFPSLYSDRYRKVSYFKNNKKYTFSAKFPILISPLEKIEIEAHYP